MSIIQPVAEQTPAGAVVSAPAPAVEAGGAVAPLAARAPRPMLARDADSMYWMCRYVERAEHVARLMAVNDGVLTDLGDLAASLERRQWRAVLRILRMPEPAEPGDAAESNGDSALPFSRRVTRHMIFEADNPNGLLCCLTRARDNARGIRENISSEMWESLNALYWFIAAEDAPGRFAESSGDFYRQVMTGSMLFQGLADQTLPHDQPWRFTQLAKHLERADVTCRVIDHGFQSLEAAAAAAGPLETPLRNIHWTA
ncbi:MAG TPA: alpha-E domain-containing protein, partial [Tepidisphaeraceae bacterium]